MNIKTGKILILGISHYGVCPNYCGVRAILYKRRLAGARLLLVRAPSFQITGSV